MGVTCGTCRCWTVSRHAPTFLFYTGGGGGCFSRSHYRCLTASYLPLTWSMPSTTTAPHAHAHAFLRLAGPCQRTMAHHPPGLPSDNQCFTLLLPYACRGAAAALLFLGSRGVVIAQPASRPLLIHGLTWTHGCSPPFCVSWLRLLVIGFCQDVRRAILLPLHCTIASFTLPARLILLYSYGRVFW